MLRWLFKYSGKICCVCIVGLVVSGVIVGSCMLSSIAIPVELLWSLYSFATGTLCSGLIYIVRQDGIQCGRSLERASIEIDRNIAPNNNTIREENVDSHHYNLLLCQEIHGSKEDQGHAIFRAQIESLTRRVSDLEGQQAARFHSEARREIHHERMLYGRQFETDSDSDEESKSNLVAQGVFARSANQERHVSANDVPDLGVEIRHRNNTRN